MNYVYCYFPSSSIKNRQAFINYLNSETIAYVISEKNNLNYLMFAKPNIKYGKHLQKSDIVRCLYRYMSGTFYYNIVSSPETYRDDFLDPITSKNYEILFR